MSRNVVLPERPNIDPWAVLGYATEPKAPFDRDEPLRHLFDRQSPLTGRLTEVVGLSPGRPVFVAKGKDVAERVVRWLIELSTPQGRAAVVAICPDRLIGFLWAETVGRHGLELPLGTISLDPREFFLAGLKEEARAVVDRPQEFARSAGLLDRDIPAGYEFHQSASIDARVVFGLATRYNMVSAPPEQEGVLKPDLSGENATIEERDDRVGSEGDPQPGS